MIWCFVFAIVLVILAEGTGCYWKRVLGVGRRGYSAPIGMAVLFTGLQLLYYPCQLGNYSFRYVCIVSFIILGLCVFFTVYDYKEVIVGFQRKETVYILLLSVFFVVLLQQTGFSTLDANPFSMNESCLSITSQRFQGYELFTYFLFYIINFFTSVSQAASQRYLLGLVYVIVSCMLVFDILKEFTIHHRFMYYSLLLFLLFNGNYVAWNANLAYRGISWCFLFLTLAVYAGYLWLKSKNEMIKYFWLCIFTAGLSCDGGFGIASIAILYGFMVYLLKIRKIRCFFDFFTFIAPLVMYTCAYVGTVFSPWVSLVLLVGYFVFLARRYKKRLRHWIARSEEFLFDHYRLLFLIAVPCVFAIGSLVVILVNHNPLFSYTYYFTDFYAVDGLHDYLFLHSSYLEWGINLMRWAGIILLLISCEKPSDQSIRMVIIVILLLFLNPLCVPLLTYVTGPGFQRTFEVLFNPFTEALLFTYAYQKFQWTFIGKWLLELLLLFGAATVMISTFL